MIKNVNIFGKKVKLSPFLVSSCPNFEDKEIGYYDFEEANSKAKE